MRLGIKVHWRDVDAMAAIAERHGATVLEYQMLPGDLEKHRDAAFEKLLPFRGRFELRVHQPEGYLHEGGVRFLDIASPDPEERARSAQALAESARHAMELRAKAMIVHPGGVRRAGGPGGSVELLRESLEDVPRHVPLLLENMPWFYDLRNLGLENGESPLFTRGAEGLRAVDDLVDGYVLDVSHGYLSRPEGARDAVEAFVGELGARIRHVHANGSRAGIGSKGEGTPFHDSDYGADWLGPLLRRLPTETVVVPEIMDGHRDGGRWFDEGLAFLRNL